MEKKNIVVEARSLTKKYRERTVVQDLQFQIREGECYGFLGPNGAGKSTTLRMMYCSSVITTGELFILGLNVKRSPREIKARLGVVPQEDGLDPDFSVLDNLLVYARYHNIPSRRAAERSRELLRFMHLEDYDDQRVETLSGGMRRRLAIARGLLNEPSVLILDEPTTGLDPQARIWIWDRLQDLKSKGMSLVISTHYMEEAEQMCDRIGIMDNGKLLAEGLPKDLIAEYAGREVVEVVAPIQDINYLVTRIRDKYDYQILSNRIRLFIKDGQDGKESLKLVASSHITVRKATLEDVFLKITGHELRDFK